MTDSGYGRGSAWTPLMHTAPECVSRSYVRQCHSRDAPENNKQQGRAQAFRLGPLLMSYQCDADSLTRRPCGGGCACGRGARPQTPHPDAASARRGHGHAYRDPIDPPYRRSACDPRPGTRSTESRALNPKCRPNAPNAHGHPERRLGTRRASHGLGPLGEETNRPGPPTPPHPGLRACAWRAVDDRSCPPGYPGR